MVALPLLVLQATGSISRVAAVVPVTRVTVGLGVLVMVVVVAASFSEIRRHE
jgi:hypothetical protein